MIALPSIVKPPKGGALHWGQIPIASHGLLAAELASSLDAPVLLLTADTASAYQLEQNMQFFAEGLPVKLLPDWETLPYDNFSPHEDIVSERLRTLSELTTMRRGILVAPISTLMQRIAPPDYVSKHSLILNVGQTLDIDSFRQQLEKSGYRHVDTVYQHGEYASRGAIIDIFPMGSESPYRIDLLDEEIDSLRSFEPGTLFDYLPANSWLLSSAGIEGAAEHYWQDIQQRYEQRIGDIRRPVLPPATVFQTVPEIFSRLKDYPRVTISEATLPDSAGSYNFAIDSSPPLNIDSKQDDPIAALREYCRDRRVLFCAESAGRREALIDLLTRHKLKPKPVSGWREFTTGSDSINITIAPLDEGDAKRPVTPQKMWLKIWRNCALVLQLFTPTTVSVAIWACKL